jgi:hypothetical protein
MDSYKSHAEDKQYAGSCGKSAREEPAKSQNLGCKQIPGRLELSQCLIESPKMI